MQSVRSSAAAILAVLFLALVIAVPAGALDSVKKQSGQTVSGTIKGITKDGVEIEKTAGGSEKVPVLEIDSVRFDGEPTQLASVRALVNNGAIDDAVKQLAKVDPATATRPEAQQELQFYKAYCQARQALAGNGDVTAAGTAMNTWLKANGNSFHFYPATELVGDLLVKAGNFEAAASFYGQLEQAPIPELKMRAGTGIGRSLLAEKKYPEAQAAFDKVLTLTASATGAGATTQRFAASIGKATCLAETGKPDDAIKAIEEVIKAVSPDNTELMAPAYVALGKAYLKKPEAKKQALLAFLHVDTLYSGNAQAHAEALRQLDPLWRDLGKPERALQAVEMLRLRYSASGGQ